MVVLCQIVTRLVSVCLLVVCLVISVPSAEASTVRHFKWEVKHEFKSPDCYNKLVITINGKSPGPTILAQQNDTVIVELKNSLETENVAIHWHGIRQKGQCPILPGDTFVYKFVVDRPGTYMYHAHYGMQRTCGLYGSIRVAHPDGESEPLSYDYERRITLNDWYHKSTFEQAAGLSSIPFVWVGEPQSLLIQGKGQFDCHTPGESERFSYYYDRSIILNGWYHKSPFEQAAGLSSIPFVWVGEPQSLLIQGKGQFDCHTPGESERFSYYYDRSIILNGWYHKSPFEQAAGLSSIPFVWVGEPQSLLIQGKGQFDCHTPGESERFSYYYDRSIILNGWYHKSPFEQAAGLSSIPFVWVGEPQSLLIQGKGQFDCCTLGIQASLCNATNPECSPYVLWVIPGKTYRLRIGSLTALAALSFEIEGHNMTVVDGKVYSTFCLKNISEEHCNYFKFVDDDDYDVISNVAPRTSIKSEEFNDPSTRVYEMDNEFQEHGRRLRKMEKKLNVVLYVICIAMLLHSGMHHYEILDCVILNFM
ncbi:hypothetical protein TEA_016725 [Camellia sinensis var. sinensis]|uniref:L-ascorbate oxidase n=1 Tax=Camellia sinensis var. sinensis TaxID=542762 RepID=A0A4S4F339_CAMSN|nr:hypothetical protein TEA_016725 [Camellia sinensis var. sinensis]